MKNDYESTVNICRHYKEKANVQSAIAKTLLLSKTNNQIRNNIPCRFNEVSL